jgi:DNA helicase-2/ATP-dependent DNA helicase PcrA
MEATNHPAFHEENEHLRVTVHELEIKRDSILKEFGIENMYAPPDTIRIFSNQAAKGLRKCKYALEDLYFGRVDWKPDAGEKPEKFYLGKTPIYPFIIAWQDTLASDLYYNRATKREQGELLLVRTLRIDDRVLLEIEDNFQDPSVTGELDPDSMLARLLQESRGRLREIIATINAQQNRIIRTPLTESLIVQGVPGSGKTVIALHRVSYLLYNHEDMRPQDILILGPNPIFMQYVSRVLPSLGERKIPQVTFDQWLIDQLGEQLSYQTQEDLLEFILAPENPSAEKIMHLRNCQNMGSLRMGKLLDRYREFLWEGVLADKPALSCRYQPLGTAGQRPKPIYIERNLEEIRTIMSELKGLPFNHQREAVELRLANEITAEIMRKLGSVFQEEGRRTKEIFSIISGQIHDYFSSWRAENVSVAYRRLFRQRGILQRLGSDLFTRWGLELMTIDAPTAQTPFRFSDLVGLLYLKILLDGTDDMRYSHIVIDEAQDIPPLFFSSLSHFTPKKSVTVMGDIGQGVFLNYGLSSWEELQHIFPTIRESVEELKICYRSTCEVMQFANDLLRRTGVPEEQLIHPLNRSGPPITLHSASSEKELMHDIFSGIKSEQRDGWKSIAVICRSASACQTVSDLLKEEGLLDYQLIETRESHYQEGVLILPAYLAKGLEFDVVILADAHNYPADDLSLRLLFVAITRAAHKLHIYWQGEISPLLDDRLERVDVVPFLAHRDASTLMTMQEYAQANRLDSDWCVELLARQGRLPLVFDGKIDPIVMDLLVQESKSISGTSPEDMFVEDLDPEFVEQIGALVELWEEEGEQQIAMALLETTFGLLQNHMRALKIIEGRDDNFRLSEQIVALMRLHILIENADLSLPGGRWTTRQRLEEAVDLERLAPHRELLQTLLDYGVIETHLAANNRQQIRVSQPWIRDLLALSLGSEPLGMDADLVARLPMIPKALDRVMEGQI